MPEVLDEVYRTIQEEAIRRRRSPDWIKLHPDDAQELAQAYAFLTEKGKRIDLRRGATLVGLPLTIDELVPRGRPKVGWFLTDHYLDPQVAAVRMRVYFAADGSTFEMVPLHELWP